MALSTSTSTSTAVVFARIDPILKRLLEGLTSLKALLPSLATAKTENDQLETTFVRLAKSIANELESLAIVLEPEPSKQQQQQQRLQHAKTLCMLAKYVALPLNAVFRLPLKETFAPPQSNSSSRDKGTSSEPTRHKGNSQRLAIRRSYVFRLYRLAAVAMRRFIEATTIINTNSDEAVAGKHRNNLLPTTTWVEHLVALVHSMPTYSESTNGGGERASANSSLDDGSDAFVTILEATNTLLACFDTTTTHKRADPASIQQQQHPTTVLLVEAWHGTLSMRLVDCLTAFLVCSPSEVFSPNVHRAALETLYTMLRVTSADTVTTKGANSNNSNSNSKNSSTVSQSRAFWRSVFPGAFAALYQRIANDATSRSKTPSLASQTAVQIQTLSLKSLISLLRMTLSMSLGLENKKKKNSQGVLPSRSPDTKQIFNDDLLAKLTSMAVIANNNENQNEAERKEKEETIPLNETKEKTETNNEQKEEEFFYDQVRKRVERPLVLLLRQLSLSSTNDIRRNVVVLCNVILFETRDCWEDKTVDSTGITPGTLVLSENFMEKIPLELCIGFQQDPDASVRVSAREIIDAYAGFRKVNSLSPSLPSLLSPSVWMVPRVIELVQKLSILVHRGNTNTGNIKSGIVNATTTTIELRTDLNLLAGYLQCLDTSSYENNETTAKELKTISTSMRNAIVSSKSLRRGLIQLFDVNLESLSSKNGSLVSLIIDHKSKSPIKLRHLDHPDLMVMARDSILRSLGRLLGPKHGAIFVDEVVSDFIEASFQMPKATSHPSANNLFAGWLHEWIGSLIVAREILWGSFSLSTIATATASSIAKKEKRLRRILLALASSILPLLVDCSLWNLSIDNRIVTTKNISINNSDTMLSPQTLQRNQIVVILLMELIGVFSQLLRGDLKEVLVTIFYPIVEKTTRRGPKTNSDVIQQTGLSTLKIMSLSCGLQSTEDLIHAEQNRLIAAMIGQLRLHGGSRIPNNREDAEEILSVTKTSIWVLEMTNRQLDNTSSSSSSSSRSTQKETESVEKDSNGSKNSALVDLVALLHYRLDHLFLQKVLADVDVETVCSLHKAFFNYFLHAFQVKREATYSYQMKNLEKDSKQPWLDLLSSFRKNPLDTQELDNVDETKENEGRLLDFAKSDIALFAKLIGRDCYLLSYQKLESRISSCDALTIAFKFLAFVGSEHYDPTDDKNVIRNTILRQVADSWPSIRARLKSLSEVILHSYSSKNSNIVLVLNQCNASARRGSKEPEDVGTQRIFLSKLFHLIATMCECSGDFFAERFRNDVWPCMARHLEYLLQELQRQREAYFSSGTILSKRKLMKTSTGNPASSTSAEGNKTSLALSNRAGLSFKMSDTQGQLIVSILKCLNRILEQEECGKAVERLLVSIGSTLLPLLDTEDQKKIQELSMHCIRSIIKINADVLRRPLMELSGTKISRCPLKFNRDFPNSNEKTVKRASHDFSLSVSEGDRRTTIGNRCHELLTFADSLPEQALS